MEELTNLLDPRMIAAMLGKSEEQEEPKVEKKEEQSFLAWWNSQQRGYQSFGTPKRAAATTWAELMRRYRRKLKVSVMEMRESDGNVRHCCYLNYDAPQTLDEIFSTGYQFYASRSKGRAEFEADAMRHMLAADDTPPPCVLDYETDLPPNPKLEEVAVGLGLIRPAGGEPITVEDLQELVDVTRADATARIEHLEALLRRAQAWIKTSTKRPPNVLMHLIEGALLGSTLAPKTDEIAFDAGWKLAAEWAKRDDLLADMDSQAFRNEKWQALERAGRPKPSEDKTAMDKGPWIVSQNDNGSYALQSDDFTYDTRLYINGDFGEDEVRKKYAQFLADKLNAPVPSDRYRVRMHWLIDNMGAAFDQDTQGYLIVYRASIANRSGLRMVRGHDWETCIDEAINYRGEWVSG